MDHTGIQTDPREGRGLDAPDRWTYDDLDPPYAKRIRHGTMTRPPAVMVGLVGLFILCAAGGLGWIGYTIVSAIVSVIGGAL